jgi:L-aminopeptidase/D-esterase-like protein
MEEKMIGSDGAPTSFPCLGVSAAKQLTRREMLRGSIATASIALLEQKESMPTKSSSHNAITDVDGIKVGHYTEPRRPTGCTVILTEAGAVAGVDVRGAAPGTRETDLLNPLNTVQEVHAIVLSGGSAFGLDTAGGVMRYLEERGIGFKVGAAVVPIVPAAIIFDLGLGDLRIRPDAEAGYRACKAATSDAPAEGNVGAGAGATVGKLFGMERAMKGGIGTASVSLNVGKGGRDRLTVGAIAAVNAIGDVLDPGTGKIIAGVRKPDGKSLLGTMNAIIRGETLPVSLSGASSTIGVVATNLNLDKAQATKVAQMAHDGFARAINPVHSPFDGDTIFALATGKSSAAPNITLLGSLAAEVMAQAVVRAVRAAKGIDGLPSAADLRG